MNKDKTQLLTENKELFDESINEFSSKPYDMASVNEIIKRSQYNKGSFYYRFKDKNELYISLLDYVLVQQVDLFKKSGFSLLNNQNPKQVLMSLFQNLIDLYHFDKRYYNIIRLLYNEEEEFINNTLSQSVSSLYERFKMRLKKMNEFNDSQLIIVESLYKNLPVENITNSKISIESIVNQVIGDSHEVTTEESTDSQDISFLVEESIDESVNYVVLEEKYIDFDKRWFDILKVSQNIKVLKNKLKFKVFRFSLNIKSILNRYKHKPIFNHLAIENLLNSETYMKIVKDKVLTNITLGLVYSILDLREYILINQSLKFLNEEQRDILLNYIMPLNGKLSKIIFMDQSVILNNNNISYFYYYDEYNGLRKLHIDRFKDKYYLKIHCHYTIDDHYYHVYYNSFQSFLRFYKDNDIKIIKLESTHELHLNDLREVVED